MAMPTRAVLASLGAGMMLVGLLTGCGIGQQAATSQARSGNAARPHSSSQRDAVPYHKFIPKAVELHASRMAPAGTVSAAWSMRSVAEAAISTRVYLFVAVPVCSGGQMAYTLATTSKSIEIGYWVRPTPKHRYCSAIKVTADGYLRLPTAIGHRTITHVPVGRRAPY